MFTILQIETAHSEVKSGADFPGYIQTLKTLGVVAFETWVTDSHTEYFGRERYQIRSEPMYDSLVIAANSDLKQFKHCLHLHQQGQTDYLTFCSDCAATGVERWFVCLDSMTCTYYDQQGKTILTEHIPGW